MHSRVTLGVFFVTTSALLGIAFSGMLLRKSFALPEGPLVSFPAFQYEERNNESEVEVSGEFRYENGSTFPDIRHHIFMCKKDAHECTHSFTSVGWDTQEVKLGHVLYVYPILVWNEKEIIFFDMDTYCADVVFRIERDTKEVQALVAAQRSTPDCEAYKGYPEEYYVLLMKQRSFAKEHIE
jgi:hypothetical protein